MTALKLPFPGKEAVFLDTSRQRFFFGRRY